MVATLLLPDQGRIHVDGYDVEQEPRRARERVGYVLADERSFHWRLNAENNLLFFARLDGMDVPSAKRRIAFLLERLDLMSARERPFGQYSTGMKHRLAVARALLMRPRVLLMDEPTRSIDRGHAAEVWRLVREEIEEVEGCLVVVTHQVQEALGLCNRVSILADGSIAIDTSADSLGRFTSDLDGFTVSVRGLAASDMETLRDCEGICDVRLASHMAGEQVLEVWTANGEEPLASFLNAVTSTGATVCSLQRATPLQGVIERLIAHGSNGTAENGHYEPVLPGATS